MDFNDKFNRKIILTQERWKHINDVHPELKDMFKKMGEALEDPELIKTSVYDENVVLFYKYFKHIYNGKYMCVVVRLEEKLIATAYITDRIKEGEIVWKKN
jgi:hypothetical protein